MTGMGEGPGVRASLQARVTAVRSPEADLPAEVVVLPALLAGFGDAGVVLAAELNRQPLALVAAPLHHGDLLIRRRGAEFATDGGHGWTSRRVMRGRRHAGTRNE